MPLREPSFSDESCNSFTEGCYLANKSSFTFCVLNANVKFSWETFKIQARCRDIRRFFFGCITRDVKQHVFAKPTVNVG